jgi:hypothetical protein
MLIDVPEVGQRFPACKAIKRKRKHEENECKKAKAPSAKKKS